MNNDVIVVFFGSYNAVVYFPSQTVSLSLRIRVGNPTRSGSRKENSRLKQSLNPVVSPQPRC